MLKNIISEHKNFIIVTIIYYFLVFSGIGKHLGVLAVILAAAGWIIVPMTIYIPASFFWEKFDMPFLKFSFVIICIVLAYSLYFSVEESLNVFFSEAECRPTYWYAC